MPVRRLLRRRSAPFGWVRRNGVLARDGVAPGGRLLDGSRTAGGSVNLRLPLTSVDDLDDEAAGLIGQAYRANQ
jgi:hypothetical protein